MTYKLRGSLSSGIAPFMCRKYHITVRSHFKPAYVLQNKRGVSVFETPLIRYWIILLIVMIGCESMLPYTTPHRAPLASMT